LPTVTREKGFVLNRIPVFNRRALQLKKITFLRPHGKEAAAALKNIRRRARLQVRE
jgi:hypothetical protein